MSNENNNGKDKELKDFEGLGKLLDHNYDNIQELDNPLPGWWLVTFWATIIFSLGYYAYYEFLGGPTSDEELAAAMATVQTRIEQSATAGAGEGDGGAGAAGSVDVAALMANSEVMAMGKTHFDQKCMPCHGLSGEGTIGPNLTDAFWIHGSGDFAGIQKIIKIGVLDKGMPPWEQQMKPEEVDAVTAYVMSLKGTNPPNGKAPQGEKYE